MKQTKNEKYSSRQWAGSGLVVASALFFSTYGVWAKLMGQGFGEFSQAWTRAMLLLPVVVLVGVLTKQFARIARIDLKWFIFLGLLGALNQAPYYIAFQSLPVGTATLLFYLGLVAGGYGAGKVLFGERFTKVKVVSFVLGLLGLIAVFGLDMAVAQLWPAFLSLLAGAMGATAIASSKKLTGQYSELQVIMAYLVLTVPINLLLALVYQETLPPVTQLAVWLPAIGYAASYLLANLLVVAGFKYLEPSVGSIIGLVEVPFAIIFGLLLFAETLSLGIVIGSALIILAAALPDIVRVKKLYSSEGST